MTHIKCNNVQKFLLNLAIEYKQSNSWQVPSHKMLGNIMEQYRAPCKQALQENIWLLFLISDAAVARFFGGFTTSQSI